MEIKVGERMDWIADTVDIIVAGYVLANNSWAKESFNYYCSGLVAILLKDLLK